MKIVDGTLPKKRGSFKDKKVASEAGKKAHKLKRAHEWSSEDAKQMINKRWEEKKRKDQQLMAIL